MGSGRPGMTWPGAPKPTRRCSSPKKASPPGRPSGCAPDARSGRNACKTPWTAVSGSACGAACPNANAAPWRPPAQRPVRSCPFHGLAMSGGPVLWHCPAGRAGHRVDRHRPGDGRRGREGRGMTTARPTTATAAAAAAAPRTLHPICELTRLAACGYCPADGLDWPCTSSGTGPEGYHVARFAAAMRRGLITRSRLRRRASRRPGCSPTPRWSTTSRWEVPNDGRLPGPAAPDALAAALAPDWSPSSAT